MPQWKTTISNLCTIYNHIHGIHLEMPSSLLLPSFKLFGTSGVRGYINRNVTPDFVAKMGLAFAISMGGKGKVAVARDVRPHSLAVQKAVESGLMAGGVDVVDCGVAPTPSVLYFLLREGLDGAVVVTGSHTIAPIVGLLFFQRDGGEISPKDQLHVEKIYFKGKLVPVPWNRLGRYEMGSPLPHYEEAVIGLVNLKKVSGYRIVVDPGNGASSACLAKVLSSAGCHVWAINDVPDGRFPNRPPYPRREVLASLIKEVRERKADLGVATDGDGDRAVFVTEKGKVVWGDVTGALFAREELRERPGGTVVTSINSSDLIHDVCRGKGKIVVTRVGPPAIIDALRNDVNAVFGFEETGKFIWPGSLLYGDCALSTLKMLSLMNGLGMSLHEAKEDLPRYHMIKRAYRCSESLKGPLLQKVYESLKKEGVSLSTTDGVKARYPDGSWLLLRPSGTEPFFRCYAEARSAHRALELARHGLRLIREASS